MKRESFVMIDDVEQAVWTDAVMLSEASEILATDAVVIDDNYAGGDFITLREETQMLGQNDIWDMSAADWNQGGGGGDDIVVIL
jgi:hypothetical protein